MMLADAAIKILEQLREAVDQLHPSHFTRPSRALSGSTIGQHVRHILEFFCCLETGCKEGTVNYDKRDHDAVIANDKGIAAAFISDTIGFVRTLRENKELTLLLGYDPSCDVYQSVSTNTMRELVYNIEHAVHHMAIIKIGMQEIAPEVALPKHFGKAASTIRFEQSLKINSNH